MIELALLFATLSQTPVPPSETAPLEPAPVEAAPLDSAPVEAGQVETPAAAPAAATAPLAPPSLSLAAGDWNAGAGVIVAVLGLGPGNVFVSSSGGLNGSLERRLGPQLWLTMEGSGGGSVNQIKRGDDSTPIDVFRAGFRVSPGLRYQLVDDTFRVRPSATAALGGGLDAGRVVLEFVDGTITEQRHSLSVGLSVGGAVDVSLTESITLRLASEFAQGAIAGHSTRFTDEENSGREGFLPDDSEDVEVAFGLRFAPQVQLRVFF